MLKRLLLFVVVGVVFLAGCAKPPVAKMDAARRVVAHAYAYGAASLAAEEYQQASAALRRAEQLVEQGEYQAALDVLELVRDYSNQALALTAQRRQQIEDEKAEAALAKRVAEKKAREEQLRKQQQQQQQQAQKKVAPAKTTTTVEQQEPEPPSLVDQVEVAPAENLQMIAARPEVYADGLLWPLIYKANRDQIKDPKEIFAGQILLIPRDKSPEEIEAARVEAADLKLF